MHYYKFNIADWVKDTAHLSLKEEAILLRLINYYVNTESYIPLKTQMVTRKLRIADESETVEILLDEFFIKSRDGWRNKELDKTISEYQKRAERNKLNGRSGGRPKIKDLDKPTGLPSGKQVDTESKPDGNLNYKPLTTNQELETNKEISLSDNSDAITVLTYMNEVCSSKYKHSTKSHIENINARLAEGHSIEDCKSVIDSKFAEWGGDSRMAGYLRPSTLFSTGKFQGYLMAAKTKPRQSKHDLSNIEYKSGSF